MLQGFQKSFSCLYKISFFFVLCLSVSLPGWTGTPGYNQRTVTVNTYHPSVSLSDLGVMEKDYTLTGQPTGAFATNDITVIRNNNFWDFKTDSAFHLSTNTLTIDGDFTFTGNQAAAHLLLDNQAGNAGDTSAFDMTLSNNTLRLYNGVKKGTTGSIYGALLQTNNSAPGIGSVTENTLDVSYTGGGSGDSGTVISKVYAPNLIGGSIQLNMNTYGLGTLDSPVPVNVTKNQIIAGTPAYTIGFYGNLIGGQAITTIGASIGMPDYAINNTISDNAVTTQKGEFNSSLIIGGETRLINTTNATHHGALSGNVTNNRVNILSGTYNHSVIIGGRADLSGTQHGFDKASDVNVTNNTISISGGSFYDTLIIGGATSYNYLNQADVLQGNVTGNTIFISGDTKLNGTTTLIGGYTSRPNANTVSGNMLSLGTTGLTAFGVDGFDTYEFDVTSATAGATFLTVTHGNGHNNSFFGNYEKNLKNSALNVDGATVLLNGLSTTRLDNLKLGQGFTLLEETSDLGLTGTIANNGEQTDITEGGVTYSYKLVQSGNAVHFLHNKISSTVNWTEDINFSAANYAGGDVSLEVLGDLRAANISVTGNSQAAASLTATTLDVTAQNTTLTLNGTSATDVQFGTINVATGNSFTKTGSGFYSFGALNIDGATTQFSGLDAMSATNTVNLTGGAAPNFGTINLGNGSTLTVTGGSYDFDTLNVYGQDATLTGDLNATDKALNFYLADTTAVGDTVLNVTGNADLTGSQIQVGIPGTDSPLKRGDELVLVNAAGMTGDPATLKGVGMQGLLLTYDFDVNVVANQLTAVVTKAGLTEESKAFLEGRASSLASVSQGADFAADQAMQSAIAAATARDEQRLALFTAFGGGKSRYETGSHVDVTGANATVGLSHAVSIFKADFVAASFIEYGKGSYHTYNTFSTGPMKGSGDTEYIGLGALVRYFGPSNTYIDASLRAGQVSTDFSGNVFYADRATKYDYDAFYYGGHFGLGWMPDIGDDFQMDLYARYLLAAQQSKNVTLTSGDKIHFEDAFSSRVRAGMKAGFFNANTIRPYVGAAVEYEFDGAANATAYRMRWDAPSLEGTSGVGEAGVMWVAGRWTFGLGAEGYVGQRRGVRGNAQIGYQF